jgi:hypothetical protein
MYQLFFYGLIFFSSLSSPGQLFVVLWTYFTRLCFLFSGLRAGTIMCITIFQPPIQWVPGALSLGGKGAGA